MLYCDYVVELGKLAEQDTLGAPLLEEGEIFSALHVSASLVVTSKLFYILLFYYPEQSRIPCGWNLVYSAKTRI